MYQAAVRGRVVVHSFTSQVLASNPLGDPTERDLYVYLPPGYDAARTYPALMALSGFGSTGGCLFNLDPAGESLGQRMDRLISSGACPPAIVVAPDCYNRFGGSQCINSTAIGDYADYLVQEVRGFVGGTYSVGRWGAFGKSSGGYGALVLGMLYPDAFEAVACHSGDSNFELCYVPDFPAALDAFRSAGGPEKWLRSYEADPNRGRGKYHKPLNILAMAAHYSPNPASAHLGVDFPFDLQTGALLPEVWERWRAWDPVSLTAKHRGALAGKRLLYIEAGRRDEYGLHWGARALTRRLVELGVSHEYVEFDDGHRGLSYRFDQSLPRLAKALI